MKTMTQAAARGWLLSAILLFCLLLSACSGNSDAPATMAAPGDSPAEKGKATKPTSRPMLASYSTNFVGEWKSLESEKRDPMIISKSGKNFIITGGKKAIPGIYDQENKVIRMNVGAPLDIMYLEKEDMLVVSGFGKYRRISRK